MKINKKKLVPILITAIGVLIAIFAGNNEKGGKLTDALGTVANLLGAEGVSSGGSSPTTDAPSTAGGISGTYAVVSGSDEAAVTYSGSNFLLTFNGMELGRGSFIVQGNSVIHNDKPYFTIVDANTLKDPDGELWRRSGAARTSTPRSSGNTGTGDIFDQMMRESDKNRAEKSETWDSETRRDERRKERIRRDEDDTAY